MRKFAIGWLFLASCAAQAQTQPPPPKIVTPTIPAFKYAPPPAITIIKPPVAKPIQLPIRGGAPATSNLPLDQTAPPPVAMYPPKDEPQRQVSGSVAPDPAYEAVIQAAFAARDQRAKEADALEKQAEADRARATDYRRRLAGGNGTDAVIAAQDAAATRADTQAREIRPKIAPPLTDAEKAADAQRLAQMAPSGRDGYCRELANPSGGAVAASVVCSCGEQYAASLMRQVKALRDKGDGYVTQSKISTIMDAQKTAKLTVRWGNDVTQSQYSLHQDAGFAQIAAAGLSKLCQAVAFRDSDPRRRLVPVSAMRGYEPAGSADMGAKGAVYSTIREIARELAEMPGLVGRIRVNIAKDAADAQLANTAYQRQFEASALKYRDQFQRNLDSYYESTSGDAMAAAENAGRQIGQATETGLTSICDDRLKQETALMADTDHAVVQIASEYRSDRSALLSRFKTDFDAWEALAKRNGAAGPVFAGAPGGDVGIDGRQTIAVPVPLSVGGPVVPTLWGDIISPTPARLVSASSSKPFFETRRRGYPGFNDPALRFHHQACVSQYGKLVNAARAIYGAGGANIDFHMNGAMPAPQPSANHDDRFENYELGFDLWLPLDQPAQQKITKVADLQDAQGGRYPEDGP